MLQKPDQQEHHWIALSDLMTALMIIFLLIGLIYLIKYHEKTKEIDRLKIIECKYDDIVEHEKKISDLMNQYNKTKADIHQELKKDFSKDADIWGASIENQSIIFYKDVNILFDEGKDVVKPQFKNILADFIPRYIELINRSGYKNKIEEILIEGHTNTNGGYLYNMDLAQKRSLSTLNEVIKIYEKLANDNAKGNNWSANMDKYNWTRQHMTATGWSFVKPILNPQNSEVDLEKSKRVEFRIKTDAEKHLETLLKAFNTYQLEDKKNKKCMDKL